MTSLVFQDSTLTTIRCQSYYPLVLAVSAEVLAEDLEAGASEVEALEAGDSADEVSVDEVLVDEVSVAVLADEELVVGLGVAEGEDKHL